MLKHLGKFSKSGNNHPNYPSCTLSSREAFSISGVETILPVLGRTNWTTSTLDGEILWNNAFHDITVLLTILHFNCIAEWEWNDKTSKDQSLRLTLVLGSFLFFIRAVVFKKQGGKIGNTTVVVIFEDEKTRNQTQSDDRNPAKTNLSKSEAPDIGLKNCFKGTLRLNMLRMQKYFWCFACYEMLHVTRKRPVNCQSVRRIVTTIDSRNLWHNLPWFWNKQLHQRRHSRTNGFNIVAGETPSDQSDAIFCFQDNIAISWIGCHIANTTNAKFSGFWIDIFIVR